MYNQTTKQLLVDRIGWKQPTEVDTDLVLSTENKESTSGQFFNSFHPTCLAENVYYCIQNDLVDVAELNDVLYQMKIDSVNEVLKKVFDTNPLANYASLQGVISINYALEYDVLISSKNTVFDEAIGWSMASRCLRLFLTTNRSNAIETNIGMTYDLMKYELDGIKNEYGRSVGKGTIDNFEAAINNVIMVLFPTYKNDSITPDDPNGNPITDLKKPTIRSGNFW